MSLEALLTGYKGNGNPIQKLVNTFHSVDTAFHREINFSPETPEYRVSTKLDSTRELIEELKKLINKDTKQEIELGSLDFTEAGKTYNSLVGSDTEEEIFLQALLDFGFEEAWSQAQQANSTIAEESAAKDLIQEFLKFEKTYTSSSSQSDDTSMEMISDHTSDEEQNISKRQKIEQDKLEEVFSASEDQDQKFVDAYLQAGIDTSDVPIIPQRVVDISITEHDISVLNECIKKRDLTFIQQFAVKNDLTREEAYSLLLTQAMANHDFPHKTMKELFEFIEPDITIFNKQNGYSFISALLTFGTREGTLYLKEYINTYEWNGKIELDTSDQHAIHNTLLISNALEVTEYEYVEFVTNLLGEICTTESINAAL